MLNYMKIRAEPSSHPVRMRDKATPVELGDCKNGPPHNDYLSSDIYGYLVTDIA